MSFLTDTPLEPVDQPWRARTASAMILSGFAGLVASLILSIEAWQLAKDSSMSFGCDVSSLLSCSAVALTPQAHVLGFPNAFLGIFFGAVVLTISFALITGVRFPRWYMIGANALYTIALGFALWLFSQSYFVIHVLCPWCLLVLITTLILFAGITRINIREDVFPVSQSVRHFVSKGFDWSITGLAVFIILAMIAARYGVELFT
ncbi:vitamin K epoxide reductase family protein [Actinomyces mediterranea]|uniref:vitamin K epoxide reductase family protein n=1 Tax=Actinomyces mediterranea TaxID=1871028 RepID=UPI000970D9B8|nr:vitamin K epoxide reductase family protein [Actinomyces mediterranea]